MKPSHLNILLLAIILLSCKERKENTAKEQVAITDSIIPKLATINDSSALVLTKDILTIIKERKYEQLIGFIEPGGSIRFSPYGYIDTATDRKLTGAEIIKMVNEKDSKKLYWGTYDGSGDSILLTLNNYFKKFVYDVDFVHPEKISLNKILGSGNTLNNIDSVYKNCIFTESHFSGFEKQYEGMDWRSLRLVFKKTPQKLHLVGIIHDQWSI